MIGDDVALSRYMAEVLRKNPAFEVTSQSLSITTFRYVPEDRRSSVGTEATERYLNELNADLNDRIQKSGEAFVSNAVIRGRYVLRACIVNFHTTRADVDALPEIVARIGRAVDSEKRRS
jgi:glutamate/tyrosine decarboxylase-like PLP-dependent enzyme